MIYCAIFFVALVLGLAPLQTRGQQAVIDHSPQRIAALASGESIPNLDTLKSELRSYHACTCRCGCYAKDLDLQADRAVAFLRGHVVAHSANQKLAVILDIDETSLSNWEEMEAADFSYDSKKFSAWEASEKAPPIPGTVRIVKEAQHLGMSVVFLTGREEAQRKVTERNLHKAGYDHWCKLILRQPQDANKTALAYKSAERAKLIAAGYRIVLNVGDQWSDLRGNSAADYSVKYPDPFYFLR